MKITLLQLIQRCNELLADSYEGSSKAAEIAEQWARENATYIIFLRWFAPGDRPDTVFISQVSNDVNSATVITNHLDDHRCWAALFGPDGAVTENS